MKGLGVSLWIMALLITTAAAPPAVPSDADQPATDAKLSAAPPANPQPPGRKPGNVKEWVQANRRATRGAILGTLAGAALGALTARAGGGNAWKGAAAGGLVGGVAGFLLGKTQDRLSAGRDQAVRLAGYDPAQGYILRLEEVKSEPATVAPGGTATVSVRYLVIGPDPRERITVHCFRGIKFQDSYLAGNGPTSFVVPNGGGIVSTSSTLTLPKEAPAGSYLVEEMIEESHGRFQQTGTTPLYVAAANG